VKPCLNPPSLRRKKKVLQRKWKVLNILKTRFSGKVKVIPLLAHWTKPHNPELWTPGVIDLKIQWPRFALYLFRVAFLELVALQWKTQKTRTLNNLP
jgi:hypothetical protein